MNHHAKSLADFPLIVDLDGTLVKVDTLQEAFLQLTSIQLVHALRVLFTLRQGRAAFKAAVTDRIRPDVTTLPFDNAVIEAIKEARQNGRKVYLATAANKKFAEVVADATGMFDGVFASDTEINLKGKAKADRLVAAFGAHGFDYIGNSAADLPVWQAARIPLIVGVRPSLIDRLSRKLSNLSVLGPREGSASAYFWALRPHQWLKNALLFLPVIAGHDFSASTFIAVMIGFVSFSLGASSMYLINDMVDLPHDRAHPEKRHRPIATGLVPVSRAAIVFCLLSALSISLAALLPWTFMLALAGYFGLAMSYSFYLKRKLMIDVVALAALYGIRVVAGSAATGIVLSHWLIGFCFFIFLSLALMKRSTEMILLPKESTDRLKGRGYRRSDLPILNALTAASGFVAVLVLALYVNSPEVARLYQRPDLLWGICIILVYWLGRAFFLTGRGQMRQDPVIFAATDRNSLLAGLLVLAIFMAAL